MAGAIRPRDARAQRGAAIVTAMVVVLLATIVVAALFWREQVTVRSVENRLALSQARWIERAALDWARVILREDTRTGALDHFGEPWAVPVADTRLDETVTAGAKLDDNQRAAMLAGQMSDAQGRFNLNNLVVAGVADDRSIAIYRRLLSLLGQSESLADTLLARLLSATARTLDNQSVAASALPLLRVTDLLGVSGYDPAVVAALEPHVWFLPSQPMTAIGAAATAAGRSAAGAGNLTPVNANTATPEVLAALADLDPGAVRRMLSDRDRGVFFKSAADAKRQLGDPPSLPVNLLSVNSNWFFVRGMVRFGRVESQTETLLQRSGQTVDIVWQHRF